MLKPCKRGLLAAYVTLLVCLLLFSVHVLASEELADWKALWARHMDILQTQEAALFEHLYALGCDPRQFDDYNASYEQLTAHLSARERDALRSADQALNLSSSQSDKRKDSSSPEKAVADNAFGSPLKESLKSHNKSAKRFKKPIEYSEEVVEIDTENKLPEYELQALTDELVLKYGDTEEFPDIQPERYPASFAAIVPLAVIRAYFHARYACCTWCLFVLLSVILLKFPSTTVTLSD